MPDIRVDSWMALIEALYDIPPTSHARHRSNFVYRGLGDQSWMLETSLMRLGGNYASVERPLLRSFRKYAEPGSLPSDTIWVRLAVAQHHGLPTRLLDWTVSPRVAIHFATAEEEHYDKDAAIWCIDVVAARELLPDDLRGVLEREYAFLFSVEMLEFIRSLEELDRLASEGEFVMFFEPPSLDARIVNQGAIMSVMPGAPLLLRAFLEKHPEIYRRVLIPKELKWEVRDKLDQDNVTERMLMPGLDGLSKWLKRYYGPGPKTHLDAAGSAPVTVLVSYYPKPGKEADVLALIEKHWPTLNQVGLVSKVAPRVWRATDIRANRSYFVEMFQWKDAAAADAAHRTPEVMAIWEPMHGLLDEMQIARLDSAAQERTPARQPTPLSVSSPSHSA